MKGEDTLRFRRLLVANRGEIAMRILKTCRDVGLETVVATSSADRHTQPALAADRAVCIGPPAATDSYLRIDAVITAAKMTGCDAVHPGYGFLAESGEFARRCADEGLTFVGPSPAILDMLGDKVAARAAARSAGIPMLEGSSTLDELQSALDAAERLGYPVLLKPSRGGGGKGMRVVEDAKTLEAVFASARHETSAAFGDGGVFLERWVPRARHVEVQVVGDGQGHVIHLGDRDCSVQRRQQKLVEEAPAPGLPEEVQLAIRTAAVALCEEIGYDSIGTVEFLVDADSNDFFFLEVNPRIQVEHGVTEMITGIDLVQLQLLLAGRGRLPLTQADVTLSGVAVECRINAESPLHAFRPSPGTVHRWHPPEGPGVRVDTFLADGAVIPPFYDSLAAKVMARGGSRQEAVERLHRALDDMVVEGIDTTRDLARWIVTHPGFAEVDVHTRWLEESFDDFVHDAHDRSEADLLTRTGG